MPRPPQPVSAADRDRARHVSLRRIARLFRPHRMQLGVVIAIIVVSSVVSMASPFLLRAVIDDALPRPGHVRCSCWLVVGMLAVAASHRGARRRADLDLDAVGQQVMHRLRTDVFAHLQRQSVGVLHPHPHRRGAVADHQRHRRHAGGRHLDGHVDRSQPDHGRSPPRSRWSPCRWQLSLVSLVVLPPAVLLSPPGRPDARATSRRSDSASSPTSTSLIEEGLSVSGVQLAKTLGTGDALVERFTASSDRPDRPRDALPARRDAGAWPR